MDKKKLFQILARLVLLPIILSIGVSICMHYVYRANKELSFDLTSKTEFQTIERNGWPDIKLFYRDKLLDKAGLVTIKLINTGNTPIYSNEFDGPISLNLETGSRFVASRVVETQPKNLSPRISTSGASAMVEPLLLNPNDAITFQVLTTGNINSLRVNARIGGIKDLTDLRPNFMRNVKKFSWILLAYSLICYIEIALLPSNLFSNRGYPHMLSRQGGILIGVFTFLNVMVSFCLFSLINNFSIWVSTLILAIVYIVGVMIAVPFQFRYEKYKQSTSQKLETKV
jgi:hypothetical protein